MTTSSSERPGCRGLRLRLLSLFLSPVLLAAACTAPASSEPEAPAAARILEAPEPTAEPTPRAEGETAGGGQGLIDSEELIGLGELGLLPSLLQSFGAVECDFDDAFSTCQ